jgi:polyisoprenoid-binding protein YceI
MREGIRKMAHLVPLALVLLGAALAQTPYGVEGVARYRGFYPLGSWEGKNPTPRGQVVWDGERASGEVCLEQKAWDSGNRERDEKSWKILGHPDLPRACLYPQRAYFQGDRFVVEGELAMAGKRLPVRLEGRLEPTPEGFRFTGGFTTRFSDWGLERPRFLFLEVADRVEVFLEALLRRR